MKSGVLIGGTAVATAVSGGGVLIYKFSGEGKSQSSSNESNASGPFEKHHARTLSDSGSAENTGKTLPGSTPLTNHGNTKRYIGAADPSQYDQFPKLLDCSNCSADEWKKLINFLQSFSSSSDTAQEQYKLDQQVYSGTDPFANYSMGHVSHPTKQTADQKWFEWRTNWTNKIQVAPNEPWQCVLNLTLKNLRKHFSKIIPEETLTASAQCSSL